MALLFLSFLFVFQNSISENVAEQSSIYLNNIISGNDLGENYWALSELYSSTCQYNNTVARAVTNSRATQAKRYFSQFPCQDSFSENYDTNLLRLKSISMELGIIDLAYFELLQNNSDESRVTFYNNFIANHEELLSSEERVILDKIYLKQKLNLSELSENTSALILYSVLQFETSNIFLADTFPDIIRYNRRVTDRYSKESVSHSIFLSVQAKLFYYQDQYLDLSTLSDDLSLLSLFPETLEKFRLLKVFAFSNYVLGKYDKALSINRNYIQALSEYLELTTNYEEARLEEGVLLYSLGKFREAKEIFEVFYYDPNTSVNKATLLNNLSISYQKLGEKNKYISILLAALDATEAEENYEIKLTILSNLFNYYNSIGNNNRALSYLDEAREIAISQKDDYQLANIYASLGIFYWRNDQPDAALEELLKAKETFDISSNFFDYSNTLKTIASILIESGYLDTAEQYLLELQEASTSVGNNIAFLESLVRQAEIKLLDDKIDEAEKLLLQIDSYSLSNIDFQLSVRNATVHATLAQQKGDLRKARNILSPVIAMVLERAKTSIDSQTGFWVKSDEFISAFNVYLSVMADMGEQYEMVQLLDEIKTINDVALYNSPILRANRLTEEELTRDYLLNEQIHNLRTEYLNQTDPSKRLEIEGRIDRLSAERQEILNKIRKELPQTNLSVWSVQKKLMYNELLLHFTEVGDVLYRTDITRNTIRVRTYSIDKTQRVYFESMADELASSKSDLNDLYALYKFLELDEIDPKEFEQLTVIPDNFLYRIPLDILPYKEPVSGNSFGSSRYMIESFEFKYFTSLSEFNTNLRSINLNYNSDLSAFAISDFSTYDGANELNSLPFATQEAQDVNTTLSVLADKQVFLEEQATKTAFLEATSTSKIVHVATHSEVSDQDPLFSTIYLKDPVQQNSSDQALYAYELFDQSLNSEFIMLNSCSSGSGDFLQGSGIMGISRALRYAGAKSMALNIWAVNDKIASEFARIFYSEINNGATKAEAMREAKLELLTTGNANPHFWGGYMLIGNPTPLTKKPAKAGLLFPILVILIGSITATIKLNRKLS